MPHGDTVSLCFDLKQVKEVKFELDGRSILPSSLVLDLRRFCRLMGDEPNLITLKGDRVTINLTEEMKARHLELRMLCNVGEDLKVYQSKMLDL
jgi:hypothetical protein